MLAVENYLKYNSLALVQGNVRRGKKLGAVIGNYFKKKRSINPIIDVFLVFKRGEPIGVVEGGGG